MVPLYADHVDKYYFKHTFYSAIIQVASKHNEGAVNNSVGSGLRPYSRKGVSLVLHVNLNLRPLVELLCIC